MELTNECMGNIWRDSVRSQVEMFKLINVVIFNVYQVLPISLVMALIFNTVFSSLWTKLVNIKDEGIKWGLNFWVFN